jgi:hypothetical protein
MSLFESIDESHEAHTFPAGWEYLSLANLIDLTGRHALSCQNPIE